jgi:hypothetical protein
VLATVVAVKRRGHRHIGVGAALAAFGTSALLIPVAIAGKGDTIVISQRNNDSEGANGSSYEPSISGNGRFTAFISDASNLSGADTLGTSDIFVYDRADDEVELVSRRSNNGSGGDADSSNPSISADGRFVAFSSVAENLTSGNTSGSQIYVYDRERDKIELVSRKPNGGKPANGGSFETAISANGRFVTFDSDATNLSGDDRDEYTDIFVYDRRQEEVELVSRKSGSGAGGNDDSVQPFISADGDVVAFRSGAENLSKADDPASFIDIFAYDRQRDRVELISRRSNGGAGANDWSSQDGHDISGNGRFVAFATKATNLSPDDLDGPDDVFVYDREHDKVELVSRESDGGPAGDASSTNPALSESGRYVGFQSGATNFSSADDPVSDVFGYDRANDVIRLISRNSDNGPGGDATSGSAAISGDGRFVAFISNADNFEGPYYEMFQNAFLHDYLGP